MNQVDIFAVYAHSESAYSAYCKQRVQLFYLETEKQEGFLRMQRFQYYDMPYTLQNIMEFTLCIWRTLKNELKGCFRNKPCTLALIENPLFGRATSFGSES